MSNVILGAVEHPSETHLQQKSCKISFVQNIHFLCLFFQSLHWTRQYHCHALCRFQNDWATVKYRHWYAYQHTMMYPNALWNTFCSKLRNCYHFPNGFNCIIHVIFGICKAAPCHSLWDCFLRVYTVLGLNVIILLSNIRLDNMFPPDDLWLGSNTEHRYYIYM